MAKCSKDVRVLVYSRQENTDFVSSSSGTHNKAIVLYQPLPGHKFPSSVKILLNTFKKVKEKCFMLRELGIEKESEVNDYVNNCLSLFTSTGMHDLSVLVMLQKSENFLYRRGGLRKSLSWAKKAWRFAGTLEVANESYLRVCAANILVSRYKRLNKHGKAHVYLQEAKHYGDLLERGECTAHLLWAEGGFYKSIVKRSENDLSPRYALRDYAVECYKRSIDHEYCMADTDIAYNLCEIMYCLIEMIRVRLDFPEAVIGRRRDIVTESDLKESKYYIAKLLQLFQRCCKESVGQVSKEFHMLTVNLHLIQCGYYLRETQFLLRATRTGEAIEARGKCYSHGNDAVQLSNMRDFEEEKRDAEMLLQFIEEILPSNVC